MLHQSMEILRFCLIAYPIFFVTMAGLDLMLRIAGAFGSVRGTAQVNPESEQTPLPQSSDSISELALIAATSDETQTQQEIECDALPLLQFETVEPTCYEQKSEQQPAIETPLSQLKRYKLHGHEVVPVAKLPITIPASVKRYKLRGMAVVRLADIA